MSKMGNMEFFLRVCLVGLAIGLIFLIFNAIMSSEPISWFRLCVLLWLTLVCETAANQLELKRIKNE